MKNIRYYCDICNKEKDKKELFYAKANISIYNDIERVYRNTGLYYEASQQHVCKECLRLIYTQLYIVEEYPNDNEIVDSEITRIENKKKDFKEVRTVNFTKCINAIVKYFTRSNNK